jgi:hypothetical protein
MSRERLMFGARPTVRDANTLTMPRLELGR